MHELSLEFGSIDELRAKYGANANVHCQIHLLRTLL